MSSRDTQLDLLKDTLENISTNNGFHNDVKQVKREFIYFDNVIDFPTLMVLGGSEIFEDELGTYTISRLTARIIGYTKNKRKPDQVQCELIEDVLKCLENETYNTNKSKMKPTQIDTDEGMLHEAGEGLAMFILTVEIIYRFRRDDP